MAAIPCKSDVGKPVLSRRAALRLGLMGVPAVAALVWPAPAGATGAASISVIDAVTVAMRPMQPVVGLPGTYRPDEATTGWRPVRRSLTLHSGDILVTTPGTVIEGLYVTGRILVRAANVTIRQCEIVGNGYRSGNTGLVDCNHHAASGVLIEDCELHQAAATANVWHDGVIGHDYTARRNLVYDVVDGFGAYNSTNGNGAANVVIEANYVRNLSYFTPDPNHSDHRTHNDCIQIQGNSNYRIVGNHLRAYVSTSVGNGASNDPYYPVTTGQVITITPSLGPVTHVDINCNWIYGGSRGVIAIQGAQPYGFNLGSITGNRFGRDTRSGRTIQIDNSLAVVCSGNQWDDANTPTGATFVPAGTG
jgi:hypothetical protein